MADYTINKTGIEIDDILNRADKLPSLAPAYDSGKTLQVDEYGNIVAMSPKVNPIYVHTVTIELQWVKTLVFRIFTNDSAPATNAGEVYNLLDYAIKSENVTNTDKLLISGYSNSGTGYTIVFVTPGLTIGQESFDSSYSVSDSVIEY